MGRQSLRIEPQKLRYKELVSYLVVSCNMKS